MQYGVNLTSYKGVNKSKNRRSKSETTAFKLILYILSGFMLSRVIFTIVGGIGVAPFGIAYLLAILMGKNYNNKIINMFGVLLGYLSIFKSIENGNVYLILAITLYLFSYILNLVNTKRRQEIYLTIILAVFILYEVFLGTNLILFNVIFAVLQGLIVIPIYYIIRYGIKCIEEVKTNYFFSTEELISIFILICLIVTGVGDISIFNVFIRNIVALSVVILIAYVSGVGLGAAVGVAMGLIVGISDGNIIFLISLYSSCGMIVGIFKDTGKLLSIASYMAIYSIITIYSNNFSIYGLLEGALASLLLIFIPKNIIDVVIKEVNNDKKIEIINEKNLKGIKNEFSHRLDELKKILITLSKCIRSLSENNNLLIKNKGAALVENLADRVCTECELNRRCWERDLNNTFYSFSELIGSCEDNKIEFPEYLNKRCLKRTSLIKNTQKLIENSKVDEEIKEKLAGGREIIASHMENMASSMGDIIKDFNKDIKVCVDMERSFRKRLNKNGIEYNDIFCYTDRNGRIKLKIFLRNCEGANYCKNKILPIANDLLKAPVTFSSEGCSIDPKTNKCSIVIEETPKYSVLSHGISLVKDGEELSGDSYNFDKNNEGIYVIALSDGMGSGPEAGIESKVAIDLIESFMEVGFDYKTAINTINSVIGMKFSEHEKFTTLDLSLIDLYTGEAKIVKIGGAVSFIKTKEGVERIECNTLPFGVVDNIDFNVENRKLNHGDIIVTLSDGITEIDKENLDCDKWIEKCIMENGNRNPKDLAEKILESAKEKSNEKIQDDMTIIVSKIYSVY